MNLADVFTVVLIILGLLTVFVGVWLASASLFPKVVERCAEQIGSAPIRCGIVGAGAMTLLIAAGAMVGKVAPNAPGKLLGFVIIVLTILTALIGTSGLALRIGRGLASAEDERQPWRRVLRGGVVLAITYGTIVLLPLTLVAGFGAFVLGGARRTAAVPAGEPVTT
jgi:hypothetical protein